MRKNYLKNVALLMGLLLPLSVVAVNIGKKTKAVYSYGAMSDGGYSETPTGVVRSYYDVNNRLARVIEADIMLADNDLTLEVEMPGQEVPRIYRIYDYNAEGQLSKVRTRKYGLYSGHDRAWADFVDAETYEYDADGNLIKKTDGTYITYYTWESGNLVEETAYYVKDSAWSSTTKYVEFSNEDVNTPLAALFSDKWGNAYYYEYAYDADGNKISFSKCKVVNGQKDENKVLVAGEKGNLSTQTIWTYIDGILTRELNGYWNSSSEELVPQTKVEYTNVGDTVKVSNYQYNNGVWAVFGSTKKYVNGVVDSATSASELKVTKVGNAVNSVLLTATAPAKATADNWKVYRNGMYVGDATLADGALTYQDTLVTNGTWDYFLQQADGNTSDVISVVFNTTLASVGGIKVLKNSLGTKGDYEVVFAWFKPNTELPVLGYNVFTDIQSYETNALPENGTVMIPVEVAKDTLTWLTNESELNHTIYIETVYEVGKVKSEAISVTLQKTENPVMTKAVMVMGDVMGEVGESDVTKTEVYYYDNDNKLARKMIYAKMSGTDEDDPDKIYGKYYGKGDWIPVTYTAYDYNEKKQLVNTRERQFGVFSGYNKAWLEFEETGSFSYTEDGKLKEDTVENRVYHYTYDGENIVQETYANSTNVIIYHKYFSNFAEGLVNCPQYAFANSPYGLTTNDRIYEMSYDAEGHMISRYTYKYDKSTVVKDDEGLVIGAEKGTPEYEEFWTYENGMLAKYEKNKWKTNKNAYESETRTEYTLTTMGTKVVTWRYSVGVWAKGGLPQITWDVPFNGKSISDLTVKDTIISGKPNSVYLSATVPSGYSNNTVWNVFRNGVKVGQASIKRTALSYIDECVPNGNWDYFIQAEDTHGPVGVNVSNVVEKRIYTELPSVKNIRVVSNGLNDVKDYQVVFEWDAPDTDLVLLGYNMFVDVLEITKNPSPVNGYYPFTKTSYTYTAANDVQDIDKEFMVETVYNIGKVKSEVLAVTLSNVPAEGIEEIEINNAVLMVGNTLLVVGEYHTLDIIGMNGVRVAGYSGLSSIDLSTLNSGIYAVRLDRADGVWSGKIVIK